MIARLHRDRFPQFSLSRIATNPIPSAKRSAARALFALLAPALLVAPTTPSFAADAARREALTLEKAPAKAEPVLSVRKKLDSQKKRDGSAKLDEVVVAGQIGGMPNPWGDTHPDFPWYADQASFFLLDSNVAKQFANHAKNHGGDVDCPFCRRLATKNVNAVAIVNLVDEKGEIVREDARELLGLEEGQTVVVRGKAEMLGGNFVVINAEGIFIRK